MASTPQDCTEPAWSISGIETPATTINFGDNKTRWHEWDRHSMTPPSNQSIGLLRGYLNLDHVTGIGRLEKREHYRHWKNEIIVVLVSKSLLAVIDRNIPRPPLGFDDATIRWQDVSKEVAAWLLRHLSQSMFERIKYTKQRIVFADDVWSIIEEVNKDQGVYYHFDLVRKLMDAKITDYPNALWSQRLEEYMDEVTTIVNDFVEHRINLDPYVIILLVLGELKRQFALEVDFVMRGLYSAQKRTADYTMMDLQNIISDIRVGLKDMKCP
ncbi:hypothetical protein PENSTE_c010G09877 [Penicillium steckii]|uniref:Uncharacterized protein n=1 Tax=Penicillium steckii TaxID=303698 RepID=A0A1V6T7V2_9EURO|nr:hypothetical protein PENSTE_c010G09877 [Penicillium steckii]